jgi:hypothetical protein
MLLSYGLRYETQNHINSKADIAPRVSLSYGIPRKTGNPLTVIRAGYGIFYDRFDLGNIIQTDRQNGTNEISYIYEAANPTAGLPGCSPTSTAACGSGKAPSQTVYILGPGLRSEYNMQTQVGVDQQVGRTTTVSFNYINNLGLHQFLSRSIPNGPNFTYEFQSGGIYRQNQFVVNVRTQIGAKFSLTGFYTLNFANSNTNGAASFPTDSLNSHTDYGRALFLNRSRALLFGNWNAPYGLNFSPFVNINSGNFYNITTGTDLNGDTIFNDRAGFSNGTSGNCRNFSDFTTNVTASNRVPVGYCEGPANVSFNLRIAKNFGFGERSAPGGMGQGGPGGPGGGFGGGPRGGGPGGPGGGGMGGPPPGMFGGNSGKKYTLGLSAQIQNLFNYVPYSTPNGSLSSQSLFGKSTSLASFGPGGSSAAVRTITLQLNFSF